MVNFRKQGSEGFGLRALDRDSYRAKILSELSRLEVGQRACTRGVFPERDQGRWPTLLSGGDYLDRP